MYYENLHPSDWAVIEGLVESFKMEKFNERLEAFYYALVDYIYHPIQFRVISDAYKTFIDIPDELNTDWIVGSVDVRLKLLEDHSLIRNPEKFCKYFLYRSRQLELSYAHYEDPIYLVALSYLKWVAFNQKDDLLNILDGPYVLPEQDDYHVPEPEGHQYG